MDEMPPWVIIVIAAKPVLWLFAVPVICCTVTGWVRTDPPRLPTVAGLAIGFGVGVGMMLVNVFGMWFDRAVFGDFAWLGLLVVPVTTLVAGPFATIRLCKVWSQRQDRRSPNNQYGRSDSSADGPDRGTAVTPENSGRCP